jgi:hypothetical protein
MMRASKRGEPKRKEWQLNTKFIKRFCSLDRFWVCFVEGRMFHAKNSFFLVLVTIIST